MSRKVIFLSVENILTIHERMIREFGGDPSLRDQGLLEAAGMMPLAHYQGKYLHPSLAEMAGAYLFHLCKNHPFVDGNKRTSLAAAEVFLMLNKAKLTATNRQLEKLTRQVADGTLSKTEVLEFFRQHVS